MSFIEDVRRVRGLLQTEGRISLRALKRELEVDDEVLEELVEELVDVQQVAAREGKIVSWVGPATAELPAPETRAQAVEVDPAPMPTPDGAERRQLTVMFCDLVGSTDLSQRLDAEDLRNVVRAYQESASEVIERYEGHIAQYLGDGILVYFGYPRAHEDDAERAVRSGREILNAVAILNQRLEPDHGIRLAVRVGIHTGPVVVSEMGGGQKSETLALGGTTNIAARLEASAEPDSVVISGATLRLVPGLFVTRDLGTPTLKGISEPIRAHAVLQTSGVRSRLDLDATRLTPLVGRDQELGLLLERWEHVQEGEGQAVLIAGDAGLGKSRLVHALRERLATDAHSWLECRCSPYSQGTAFQPLIELVEQGLAFKEGDDPETKLTRLELGIELAGLSAPAIVPLIAPLLGVPLPDHYAPLNLSAELQRKKTIEALVAWILGLSEQQPLVMLFEDLHWSDPSTLELLGPLLEQIPTTKVLTLLAFRPDFEPPWPARSHLTSLAVKRLNRRQVKNMIAGMTGELSLPEEVVERIAERADGVPIFVEEVTKMVLESDLIEEREGRYQLTGTLTELAIPTTLQDSLMARLDRLTSGKEVAQLGAALGREFFFELLQAVSPLANPALEEGLARLVDAELLYQRGALPEATYTFKHAMIQDTAYQSLLRSVRQQFHERIAGVLEGQFPERVELQPEILARHCEEAGLAAKAIDYYERAALRASETSANAEAIGHFTKAIELIGTLPPSPERDHRELGLQVALGKPLAATRGFGAPEVEAVYSRARELSEGLGDDPQLGPALSGLAAFYVSRSRLEEAEQVSRKLRILAEQEEHLDWLAYGHYTQGLVHYLRGEPAPALEHFDQAIRFHQRSGEHVAYMSANTGVSARIWRAWALWISGYPDRAVASGREAIELAQRIDDPFSLAYAFSWSAVTHFHRREPSPGLEAAERAIEVAQEHYFALPLGVAQLIHLWARTRAPGSAAHVDDLLEQSQQVLADLGTMGNQAGVPKILTAFAGMCLDADRPGQAADYLNGGLAIAASTGQHFYDAEMGRLKAEAARRAGGTDADAEQAFRAALSIAREQGARSFELRAASSLARLLAGRGQKEAARQLLAPVYEWFTEGFDTQDLKDAQALLEELGA